MITFIAKPIFFKRDINGGFYPARLSSRTRGEEIADYLGGYYTIDGTYDQGGVRIHLKPHTLRRVKDGDFVDILDDAHNLIPRLKARPKIKVIAYSQPYYDFLKQELANQVVLIPHPHINFENDTRTKSKTIVGGMTGKATHASYEIFNPIKQALAKVGIKFKDWFNHTTRQDALNFYDQIDFQVVWYHDTPDDYSRFYRYPGKIINAASYGIPTIAQPILGHQEMQGYYIPAETYEDIVREALKLQDEDYYHQWSKKLIRKAEEYHISQVAELYRKLI